MALNLENIKNKKILIVGMGKSGIAAAQAMIKLGAKVYVQDSKKESDMERQLLTYLKKEGVTCFFDQIPYDMGYYDMLILSPGVSPELPFIQEARDKGAEIIGELEIAYRIGAGNYVAITGTNGKTTTTTLVGEIFKGAKRKTHVVGNIGVAVISASVNAGTDDWLITETSSFQLETTKYFKPVISAILNLTPDHLNRHHTMKAYGEAKAKIFGNQSEDGYLIINYDDKECYKLSKKCICKVIPFSRRERLKVGAYLDGDTIVVAGEDGQCHQICNRNQLKIIGDHNVENTLAAAAICFFAGIPVDVISKEILDFGGVEHRIEYCGEIDGVRYYNDSKGTNVDASITALNAIRKNIILIAGGDAKDQDFSQFVREFPGKVKKLILLGRDAHFIQEAADKIGFKDYEYAKDMNQCVEVASKMAEEGDSVLLSPACASWDMYDNYEQRGEHFKDCVSRL